MARRRSFSLRGKQAAVRVAEETNSCDAARRSSVLIVNKIGGQPKIEVDLFPGFYSMHAHTHAQILKQPHKRKLRT